MAQKERYTHEFNGFKLTEKEALTLREIIKSGADQAELFRVEKTGRKSIILGLRGTYIFREL